MTEPTPPYENGRLVSTWETLYKDGEGDGHIEVLHKYDYDDESALWTPAQPARITPSRARPKQRDYRLYGIITDAQIGFRRVENDLIPLHDPRAIRAAQLLLKDYQPDEIVDLGDQTDYGEFSSYKPDSQHFHRTLGPALQATHDYYAQLRANNPNSKITVLDSNHNIRLRDWVLKHMPQFHNLRRPNESDEYPMMTFPYLANLQHLGVNFVSGYKAAEYQIGGNEDLIARHGVEFGQNAAYKIAKNHPETSNIHGHAHQESRAFRTARDGRYLASIVVPALCKIDGTVPGYNTAVDDFDRPVARTEQHQNGMMLIEDYGDSHYVFNSIPIISGIIKYRGKVYDGKT